MKNRNEAPHIGVRQMGTTVGLMAGSGDAHLFQDVATLHLWSSHTRMEWENLTD